MAARVGQALREARLERGIELSEVERATKIRIKFLEAMEEDRWEELPAPVYARGFLQTYARFLGLDDLALVDEYERTVEAAREPRPVPAGVLRPGSLSHEHPRRPRGFLLAGLAAVVVAGLAVAVAVGGSDNGGGDDRGERKGTDRDRSTDETATSPRANSPSGTATAEGSEVSVELRPTGDVWVCLIDADGAHLVNGETLASGESRGPFASRSFQMTFGNGAVEMTVDGEPVKVPPLAEPLGYRVGSGGVSRLEGSAQPDCL